ncbi:MAG: hypothetical protein V3W18_09460 [candidate division Zixibacteria bacterium]
MKTLSIFAVLSLLIIEPAHAQTGACCVDEDCIDTMEEDACWWMGGYWYEGEDCDEGFICPTDYPCGFYVVGDYNGNGIFNVADVISAFSKLKTGHPDAALLCDCLGDGNEWAVAYDVNNSCTFNLADVIVAFSGGLIPERPLRPCVLCPPAPGR